MVQKNLRSWIQRENIKFVCHNSIRFTGFRYIDVSPGTKDAYLIQVPPRSLNHALRN